MSAVLQTPALKIVWSVRESVSPEEWEARVQLAAAYRHRNLRYDRNDCEPYFLSGAGGERQGLRMKSAE
jgi:hypothetical protein